MAAKNGSFDFAKALAGISTKDDHAETATTDDNSDNDSWHQKTYFDLDDPMDCDEYESMFNRAEEFFDELDRKKKTPDKENHNSTKTTEDEEKCPEWIVSNLPSHWSIHLSRIEEQQAPKKLTSEEKTKQQEEFKSLPSSVIVDLEKAVVGGRQKYMEMCIQDYSELYKPCEDCPIVTVEGMTQTLVESLVESLEHEDWEGLVMGAADDPYGDTWFWTNLHTVRALAVHFNVCTKNQAKNVVTGLDLPFTTANNFTKELLNVMLYWIMDPVFGPTLAEIIGEATLDDGSHIYEYLVEPLAEYICPQQRQLLKYKKVRDILVFYLCAELARSTGTDNNNIQVMKCLVKLDGHESWAIVEDVFISGRYYSRYGHYSYVDYLEGLNLGVSKDLNSLHKARFERKPDDPFVEKNWRSYETRRYRLEMKHKKNSDDPNYREMHQAKTEDAEKMFIRVYEFLQKRQEEGKSKKMGIHGELSSSVIEAVRKIKETTITDVKESKEQVLSMKKKSGPTKPTEKVPEKKIGSTKPTETVPEKKSASTKQTEKLPEKKSGSTKQTEKIPEKKSGSTKQTEKIPEKKSGSANQTEKLPERKSGSSKKSGSTKQTEKLPEKPVANGSSVCPEKLQVKRRKIRECGFCGKLSTPEQKFSKCGSCLHVYYCSRDCQKQHWKAGHKNQCRKK
ncbi:uncharacterized protein LOC144912188 isoform X2 [Branchiostoma floridae x Branchiostoma belcheri]